MTARFRGIPSAVRWLGAAAVGAVMVVTLVAVVSASSAPPVGDSADKQTQLQREQQAAAQRATETPGPKGGAGPARPASCPRTDLQYGTVSSDVGQFAHYPQAFTSGVTLLASDHEIYVALAGTSDKETTSSGTIQVIAEEYDACATQAAGRAEHAGTTQYADPAHAGTLTITGYNGDLILFSRSAGASGSFNVVTGHFQ